MRALSLTVLLAACSFSPGAAPPGDDVVDPDAKVFEDAAVGGEPGTCTSSTTQFDSCTVTPTTDLDPEGNQIYDTDTHVLADFPGGGNAVTLGADRQRDVTGKAGTINVILATEFKLDSGRTLRVVGSKPFGIVATGDITIDGTIDASSTTGPTLRGAGARLTADCDMETPDPPDNHVGGAGGGGGGAFRGTGGKGQDADLNETPTDGGDGGIAVAAPNGPRGGCPGSRGGTNPTMGGTGGPGGGGGGTVFLTSATRVRVAGVVHVGGGGGLGGNSIDGGGGGGGSGGLILLESPEVTVSGTLAANGGGGGSGAGGANDGGKGTDALASSQAALGAAAISGGKGFDGGAGGTVNGTSGTGRPNAAGGGGGGGCGFTSIKSANPQTGGSTISPSLTALPD